MSGISSRPSGSVRFIGMCVMSLLLGACTARVPYPLGIMGKKHVVIAMAPSSFTAPVHKLSDIQSAGSTARAADDKAQLRRDLASVRTSVDASLRGWLHQQQGVHPVGEIPVGTLAVTLDQAKRQGAELLLAVDVSGYGHIKSRWIVLMVGSGFIEAVTQGVAAADATGNPALGLGVGAEEMTSEGLTWIGGSWFWAKYFAPVTLEGRMWRVRDGRLIWHDVIFADNSSDEIWKLLTGKKLPKKQQALATSLAKAEKTMFDDLGRYVHGQILVYRQQPTGWPFTTATAAAR